MNALRRQLHAITRFALVAMLALALLPSVSHALAWAQGGQSNWAEICTPQGMKVVALESAAGDERAPLSSASHLEHCPYCALGAPALGLPPAPAADPALRLAGDAPPSLFLHAPRTLFAWATAQPRGPPLSS